MRSIVSRILPCGRGVPYRRLMTALRATTAVVAFGAALAPVAAAAKDAIFLVQLNDYDGDEAYFSLYLVDSEDRYVRTLWVSGDEERWYPDQPRWWKYVGRAQEDVSAVTGASTAPGDRSVIRIEIEDEVLDAGYRVRVDTSVEDQSNYPTDVEAPLASDQQGDKIAGTGYVRYLRYRWE